MSGDINPFKAPYFMTDRAGVRNSRARIILRGFVEEGTVIPPDPEQQALAKLALHDFDRVSRLLKADDFDQKRLSEAVLSAMGFALALARHDPDAARKLYSAMQAKAAAGRHKEDREMKRDVLAWYQENKGRFESKDDAAEYISNHVVPVKFRTARGWITDPRQK